MTRTWKMGLLLLLTFCLLLAGCGGDPQRAPGDTGSGGGARNSGGTGSGGSGTP